MIGVFLAVAASTGIDGAPEETTLRCIDCPEVQVHRVIDGDTLDTSRGRVRLFGLGTPERGKPWASDANQRLRGLAGYTSV